jgi:hypothetical protein
MSLSQEGRQRRDDKGAHQSAGPETRTIPQGEDRRGWAYQRPSFDGKRWSREWQYGPLGPEYRVSAAIKLCSRSSLIGPINFGVKCAGARSAGNPHATCDVAGAGNGVTATPKRARRGKPRIQPRRSLRATAPVLDPTSATGSFTRSSKASSSICFCPRRSRTRTATSSRNCWRTPAYWERCACKDRCVVLDGLDSHLVRSRNQLKVEHINYEICFAWPREFLRSTTAPRYVLHDRDRIFGKDFADQVKATGIQQVLSAPRSPWQRAYVERVIRTIRRECLDHAIVFNEHYQY